MQSSQKPKPLHLLNDLMKAEGLEIKEFSKYVCYEVGKFHNQLSKYSKYGYLNGLHPEDGKYHSFANIEDKFSDLSQQYNLSLRNYQNSANKIFFFSKRYDGLGEIERLISKQPGDNHSYIYGGEGKIWAIDFWTTW